jgi:hypothetical protein
MTAPRIDSLRSQLAATIDLLQTVGEELEDLHALAYDRPRLAQERTNGGMRDYALDTHGDPRARDAYRALGGASTKACESLAIAAHETIRLLREGTPTGIRTRRHATAAEIATAIAAQGRRIARGEYTPIRRLPQPKPGA